MMHATYLRLGVSVHDDWRRVVRAGATVLARKTRRDPAKREARKFFYRELIDQHCRSQQLFAACRF
ncbi:hypothetical protein DFR49_0950 [Hephaestia caeni]|uniref:Transposase n=1 Tax=Hephaestia caeni TaxID=645617 RepID=A0A397PF08_9SPHN|nr:hypothetical protein [Hephaestia caeni]RIA46409.1 hypothetical protein DFR49_0950 [Hephaestia caeni]